MTEIILFMITLGFITGQSLIEARHDWYVIMYQSTMSRILEPQNKDHWKFWGNGHELAWIVFYCLVVLSFLPGSTVLFWIPIFWIWRTIFHDGFIAIMLGEKFSYVSDHGFDGAMKRMCLGSGAFYLAGKLFILAILIMSYLSIKFNWDFWQMILNIFR